MSRSPKRAGNRGGEGEHHLYPHGYECGPQPRGKCDRRRRPAGGHHVGFSNAIAAGSYCSGTSTVSCSLGTLAAGGSATVVLVCCGSSRSGTIANTATVATDTLDSNLANNTSTVTVTVMAAPPSVPTLSTWGLALLALLLSLTGCRARFSRKARQPPGATCANLIV